MEDDISIEIAGHKYMRLRVMVHVGNQLRDSKYNVMHLL